MIRFNRISQSVYSRLVAKQFSSVLRATQTEYSIGNLGHLARASVLSKLGKTVVHAVVCCAVPSGDDSGLPLTTEYRSRQYAFGMIPDNAAKRERHGSEEETIVSRFIDRSIRPCFPDGFSSQIQVTVTNHAADGVHDPTTVGVNAASVALLASGLPWQGPVGCVRVGYIEGRLVVNPSVDEMLKSSLNLLYAGNSDRPVMLEIAADQIPEQTIKDALYLAHSEVGYIIDSQKSYIASLITASETSSTSNGIFIEVPPELKSFAESVGLEAAINLFREGRSSKMHRSQGEQEINARVVKAISEHPTFQNVKPTIVNKVVSGVMRKAFRTVILEGQRADGRRLDEVRSICPEPGFLPIVHGSAFFMRGDTHVLCTTTLGNASRAKITSPVDGSAPTSKYFFLHYDFPPYCTGDVGSASALNRRMIGHGILAEKAVAAVMPPFTQFPYTVRVVSECTSSSGSSSMASVCGASLALMDAGVPIKSAVAGLSIGLVTEDEFNGSSSNRYTLLTDIIGSEDYFGDMDFKIAGSETGITAVQLDTKLFGGVPLPLLCEALDRAKQGRIHILNEMNKVIDSPRSTVRDTAPIAETVIFDPERKRHLIGPGGEMVQFIEKSYQCDIDTTTDGVAYIYGKDKNAVQQARDLIQDLVVVVKVGDLVSAEVRDVKDFGAFVKITRAQQAMLHMFEISHDPQVTKKPMRELLSVGQRLKVKIIAVDHASGEVSVSRKQTLDPNLPDSLAAQDKISGDCPTEEERSLADVPTFPVVPPRAWSKEFFRHSVVAQKDVDKALNRKPSPQTKN